MNNEMIVLVVIGLLLVVSVVQAFQLSSLTSALASSPARSNSNSVPAIQTAQPTTPQKSTGGTGMVGGC